MREESERAEEEGEDHRINETGYVFVLYIGHVNNSHSEDDRTLQRWCNLISIKK